MSVTNYLPQDRKSFALRTTSESVGRMNLHSIATGVIRMSFKGFTKDPKNRLGFRGWPSP